MATSLWPLALAQAMALAVAMPDDAQAMASSPKPWPWERRSWHQAPGKVTKPQAMAIASGHGSRPWPWLGPQVYGQRNVSMGIGCRVWGVGYWVVDIGYRVLVFGCFGFRYRVAASLSKSNTLDARLFGCMALGYGGPNFWQCGLLSYCGSGHVPLATLQLAICSSGYLIS